MIDILIVALYNIQCLRKELKGIRNVENYDFSYKNCTYNEISFCYKNIDSLRLIASKDLHNLNL